LNIFKHSSFLYSVFIHSITAFGGPQGHYILLLRSFVEKRKDITEKELFDFNAFCQLLPGASSTQLLVLIGYRKGGVPLALATLFIWVLPAASVMGLFALIVTSPIAGQDVLRYFRFLQPMAIGFLAYATYRSIHLIPIQRHIIFICFISTILCLLFFKSPWVFPFVIICGAIIAKRLSKRSTPIKSSIQPPIKWINLTIFVSIFIFSGFLSQYSKKNNWSNRPFYNLFEHSYRFGSIVFGGGDVLIPMMYEQYVARPTAKRVKEKNQNVLKIEKNLFLSGAGMVRAIPGPVFSFSAFTGGAVMIGRSRYDQLIGISIGLIGTFLPSFLLVLFFYPIWQYLHHHHSLIPVLKGIHASTLGIMFSSTIYVTWDALFNHLNDNIVVQLTHLSIILLSFTLLHKRIMHPVYLSCLCLLMGFLL
jgi:chromate transporter